MITDIYLQRYRKQSTLFTYLALAQPQNRRRMKLHYVFPVISGLASATSILLPLYQYPADRGSVLTPITTAIAENPSLKFILIINPANGPGPADSSPDTNYLAATRALAAYPNAQLIGYMHASTDGGATRCSVPYSSIINDIRTWVIWWSKGVPISGIFVDEAPTDAQNNCVQ